jgi:hypothetical protein
MNSSLMRDVCPAYLILLDLIVLIIFGAHGYAIVFQLPMIPPLLGSNILLSTPFSNTLSPFSSLNVRVRLTIKQKSSDMISERKHHFVNVLVV